jgi:hypothetical protein
MVENGVTCMEVGGAYQIIFFNRINLIQLLYEFLREMLCSKLVI